MSPGATDAGDTKHLAKMFLFEDVTLISGHLVIDGYVVVFATFFKEPEPVLPPVFVRLARPHVEKVEELGRRILADISENRQSGLSVLWGQGIRTR
jgi:hypothetical protein